MDVREENKHPCEGKDYPTQRLEGCYTRFNLHTQTYDDTQS